MAVSRSKSTRKTATMSAPSATATRKRAAQKSVARAIGAPAQKLPAARVDVEGPKLKTGTPEAKLEKSVKTKKPKMVRDSFTIPKAEFAAIEQLKERSARSGRPAKKSEILRAGLLVLCALDDGSFLSAVRSVPAVKTGRPAKT